MMTEFDMSDLGLMHYFFGIKVKQSSIEIFILQKKYIQKTLEFWNAELQFRHNTNKVGTEVGKESYRKED